MFTKNDYREYFEMILKKETEMVEFLEAAIARMGDHEVRAGLQEILLDERAHAAMADRLVGIIGK